MLVHEVLQLRKVGGSVHLTGGRERSPTTQPYTARTDARIFSTIGVVSKISGRVRSSLWERLSSRRLSSKRQVAQASASVLCEPSKSVVWEVFYLVVVNFKTL